METKQEVIDIFFINAPGNDEMGYQYFELAEQDVEVEPQQDLKSLLGHLADQIKLIKKQLSDIRRKKTKLLKEMQKLTAAEEEFQKQLNEHTERQKILKKQTPKVEVKNETHVKSESYELNIQSLVAAEDTVYEDCGITGMEEDVGTELLAITAESIEDELQAYENLDGKTSTEGSNDHQSPENLTIGRKFICGKCQRQFKRCHHLDWHMKVCSGSQTNKTKQSTQPAPPGDENDISRWTLRPNNSHICHECNKSFSTSYTLELHTRLHRKDFRHLCNICGKAFVDVTNLNKHMEYHIRRHKCHYCDKSFGRLRELEMHQRRHTGERPYMCSSCGKAYPTSSELRYHLAYHNDSKSHVCDVCNKSFYHRQALKDHYRMHSDEKPFACLQCEQKFSNKYTLLKHQVGDHSAREKFICGECGKTFLTAGNFRGHQRSHSTDRPHKCDQCDKKYKNVYDLVIHKKKKHGTIVTPQMCLLATEESATL